MAEVRVGTVGDASLFGKLVMGGWLSHNQLHGPGMRILSRSKFTCSSCGFRSAPTKKAQHGWMVPVDYSHQRLVALTQAGDCLCPFCASAIGLNWSVVGITQADKVVLPPGMLIVQPNLSQAELSRVGLHVASILASRNTNDDPKLSAVARDIDAAFVALNSEIGTTLPFHQGKDSDFARALSMVEADLYEQRQAVIGDLRWWPNVRFWREQAAHWMEHSFRSLQDSHRELREVLA